MELTLPTKVNVTHPIMLDTKILVVIASPIAWYGIERWQENFALKAPLHWWIFLLAFLAITIITLLTVTIQNYRAASTNPVDSIRQGC